MIQRRVQANASKPNIPTIAAPFLNSDSSVIRDASVVSISFAEGIAVEELPSTVEDWDSSKHCVCRNTKKWIQKSTQRNVNEQCETSFVFGRLLIDF